MMWIFTLFVILYNFIIIFLPIFLDVGIQMWNGFSISQTDFTSRTVKWNPAGWQNVTELKFQHPVGYETLPNLTLPCSRPNYCCRNEARTLLSLSQHCDGVKDCQDGPTNATSDEDNCVSITRLVPKIEDYPVEDYEEGSGVPPQRRKRQVQQQQVEHQDCINLSGGEFQESLDCEGSGGNEDKNDQETTPSPDKNTLPLGAHLIKLKLSDNFEVIVSREAIISLALLQLPALCLALYGIFCAFHQPTLVKKLTHCLSACLLIFIPFSLVEFFTLLEVEFAHRGVQFILEKLKLGCEQVFGLCCDTCSDKTTNALDLLHFLPSKDPVGKDRALSVSVFKLIFGSCLQLCFQAVLLSGYTRDEDFKISQLLSIISSTFIITKTATAIVMFKRETVAQDEDENKTFGQKAKIFLSAELSLLKQFFISLPLMLSSFIIQSGTLFLVILIFGYFSSIYIVTALFLNLVLSLLLPFPLAKKTEEKLGLTFKFPQPDQEKDEKKITSKKVVRGLFSSWANLFIALRPVEELTYHNIIHMCLVHPLRFVLNVITLIILNSFIWMSSTPYVLSLKIYLTVSIIIVLVAGIFNILAILYYFYFGKLFFLSKPPKAASSEDPEKNIEMNDIKNSAGDTIALNDTLKYIDDDRVSEVIPLLHPNEDIKKEEGTVDMAASTTPEAHDDKNQTISAATFPQSDEDETKNKTESTSSESDEEKTEDKAASFSSESDKEKSEHKADSSSSESDHEESKSIKEVAEAATVGETETEMKNEEMEKSSSSTDTDSNNEDPDMTTGTVLATTIPLMSNISMISTRSVDASCFYTDDDFDIVEPSQEMTKEDVKQTFNNIQEQGGRVGKQEFIDTMMKLFPRYNMEENRQKLGKLFDRLDKKQEGLITFRQFMLVTICFSNIPLQDKLIKIFQLIDENRDEELTYEEFEEVVKDILVLKEERKISSSLIEERFSKNTFRDMGMDDEGRVNLRSFVDACSRQRFIIINYVENFKDGFLVNQNV